MTEAAQGILVLNITALGTSIIIHTIGMQYLFSCFVSACISSVLFQVFAYLHIGYLDPFFMIPLIIGGFNAFVVSLIAGYPFYLYRKFNWRK